MTVLITGASYGIGKELARKFASNGYDLLITARTESKLEELKAELESKHQIKVETIALDLTVAEDREQLLQTTENQRIEILINNAGFGDHGLIENRSSEKQSSMIDLNIKTLTLLTQAFIKKFKEDKTPGKILNVASIAAFAPGPFMSTYFATKAYVVSFSRAVDAEASPYGIQVSTLCPGPTHSEFGKRAGVENQHAFKVAMDAETVARQAYKEFMQGKRTIITGWKNNLLVFFMKICPYWLLNKINKDVLK